MINIKDNMEYFKYYFYENEGAIKNEIEKHTSFVFYEKYLLELTAREYLDFIHILIDDINESEFKINNKIVKIINYMVGQEVIHIDENEGFYSLKEAVFNSFQDIEKRIKSLKDTHHIEKEKEMILSKLSKLPVSNKDHKRL